MKETVEHFYKSFAALDAKEMCKSYHEDIIFEDPAFGILEGARAKNMWAMLCANQKGKNFVVTYSNITFNGERGSANWEAHYTFSQTGRKVHNKIRSQFLFKDGLIVEHRDDFNLYTWSKQALGIKGVLLGWTGFFKKKLNAQTIDFLDKFEQTL